MIVGLAAARRGRSRECIGESATWHSVQRALRGVIVVWGLQFLLAQRSVPAAFVELEITIGSNIASVGVLPSVASRLLRNSIVLGSVCLLALALLAWRHERMASVGLWALTTTLGHAAYPLVDRENEWLSAALLWSAILPVAARAQEGSGARVATKALESDVDVRWLLALCYGVWCVASATTASSGWVIAAACSLAGCLAMLCALKKRSGARAVGMGAVLALFVLACGPGRRVVGALHETSEQALAETAWDLGLLQTAPVALDPRDVSVVRRLPDGRVDTVALWPSGGRHSVALGYLWSPRLHLGEAAPTRKRVAIVTRRALAADVCEKPGRQGTYDVYGRAGRRPLTSFECSGTTPHLVASASQRSVHRRLIETTSDDDGLVRLLRAAAATCAAGEYTDALALLEAAWARTSEVQRRRAALPALLEEVRSRLRGAE